MGGLQSKEGDFKWIDKYELIDIDNNDKVLKLMSRVGENQYIGKEVVCQGIDNIQKMENLIDDKIINPSPFLMRLKRVAIKNDQGICNNSRTFYLVFEKPQQTLKEDCINRKIKGASFSEEQVQCILQSCVKAIHYLKEIGQSHKNISTSNIFLRQDRTVILSDPWVVGQGNLSANLYGITYPSPEKILFQNQLIQTYDFMLSDLFSLGIVLLEILSLQHMDLLYEKGFRRLKHIKMVEKINTIHSQQLKYNIKVLLDYNPAKRTQIFKICNRSQALQNKFILHEKQQFKNNYITTQLQTSQVRTVKVKDEVNSIINKINESQNQSDISMLTEPKVYRNPVLTFSNMQNRSNHTQQHLMNRFITNQQPQPQIIVGHQQQIRFNSIQQHPFRNNMVVHSQNVFHHQPYLPFCLIQNNNRTHQPKQIYQEKPYGQVVMKGQQLKQDNLQDKIELSSIHQNSSRGSEEAYNLQMIGEGKKDQTSIKQADVYQIQPEDNYAINQRSHEKIYKSRHLNSTIKELSEQSPSKEDAEQIQQDLFYEMGTRYKGQMKKGMREGYGTFYYVDGGYYQGEWKQNKMHGKGRFYYNPTKLIYDGTWYMDCFHGQGILYNYQPVRLQNPYDYSNLSNIEQLWQKYQGQFSYDKKHGRGKLALTNGQVYFGMFDNKEISGQGKYYRLNGQIVSGIWGNGILMQRL